MDFAKRTVWRFNRGLSLEKKPNQMMKTSLLLLLGLLTVSLTACGGGESEEAPETSSSGSDYGTPSAQTTTDGATTNGNGMSSALTSSFSAADRTALIEQVQETLANSSGSLREAASGALESFRAGGTEGVKQAALEKFNELREELQAQIPIIREATPENWEQVKTKTQSLIAEFNRVLEELRSE